VPVRRLHGLIGAGLIVALIGAVSWNAYRRMRQDAGASDLIRAVYSADLQRVRWLLDHGVEAGAGNLSGFTPLMRAVTVPQQMVDPEVIELLLERGADPNVRFTDGKTILDAAEANRLPRQVIRMLVRHGAKRSAELQRR
jgi:ankyrin repeat protein